MKLGGKVFSAEGPRYEVGGKVFSAEGARYDSQGQAPNNVRRVAPGRNPKDVKALKERNKRRCYFALSVLPQFIFHNQGRRVPLRLTLAPGYHIPRLWRSFAPAIHMSIL